jgi:hypothetical protein
MSEPSLLPGISYEEALEQIDEWQAYIASQHEAMRKQAEERRALLEKRREEMLKQAKERQEKMIEYYDSMYKKAQERRTFLEENQDNFMKEDLERQSGLSEYHQEMLKATEERRAELAAKRAELENMPLQDIRAYLAQIRKQTLEDAKSLEMEGVRAPTPPPWPDAPSYESRQGQVGRPGRGWQSPQYGPGVMDHPMMGPGGMDYPMMGPGGRGYPMGPPTELGNPPFGDWGPRSGFPKGGFGRPGMRNPGMRNPGMGNPGMGNPGMGNPGMGNPGMGNPGMGNPGMGNPGMGGPGMGRPGPQSSMTPGSAIGQEAAPPPVGPKGNASATNPEPVSRYRRPGGYPPPQFGWAPVYRLPYPAGHRSRTVVGAAHPARHQLASWRPLPRTFRPRVRHPQLAWWPSRYIPQAVVAANRFGAHPFPIAYAGPRGPMQSGAYPARQMAKRFTPAHPAKQLRPAPSFAGNWTYRPYAG